MAWSGGFDDFKDQGNDGAGRYAGGQSAINPGATTQMTIADVSLGLANVHVIGVVIRKENWKAVPNKKEPGSDRFLLDFTIRDSPVDFINVTCWGGEAYIKILAELFHIGDVVDVSHVLVQSKPQDSTSEKFRPFTPGLNQLRASEHKSTIKLYGGWNLETYRRLASIPTRPSNDYYTIADIMINGENIHGESVNLLVAVRSVGKIKDITTKTGKQLKRCEVKVFDETAQSFPLILWDDETANLAQTWISKESVLFIADVRVTYDDFRKSMISTATSKTIITTNPETPEAQNLYQIAQNTHFMEEDDPQGAPGDTSVDLASVDTMMTVEKVKEELLQRREMPQVEFCIVFGCITTLNLDGSTQLLVSTRCTSCRSRVDAASQTCVNQNCPQGAALAPPATCTTFDMAVGISDHTGTLEGARIVGAAAESTLGCTVDEFLRYDDAQRTEMKWKLLLERSKIYLKVVTPQFDRPRGVIRVVSCQPADYEEVVRHYQ